MTDQADIQALREAREAQIELGIDTERTDLAITLHEMGISGWGPDASNDDLRSWIVDPSTVPTSVSKADVKAAFADAAARLGGDTGAPRVRRGGEPASNQFGTFAVHQASPKQVAFLKRLVAEKAWQGRTDTAGAIAVPDDLDTISKKAASTLIDRLMVCPDKAAGEGAATSSGSSSAPAARLASDKAMDFLRNLIAQRDYFSLGTGSGDGIDWRARVDFVKDGGVPTARGASELIDMLKTVPYAPRSEQPKSADLELGMYRKADGTMYRVYPARQSDRILAKRLVPDGNGGWEFEYAGMASRFVTADERMTLDEAKAWGAQFGTCCVCAALLTDPTSVANGIGPICGARV